METNLFISSFKKLPWPLIISLILFILFQIGLEHSSAFWRYIEYNCRFHDDDPVFYNDGLRLTLRCGEQTDRETWKAKLTKYTTYVWVYEW